MRLVFTLGLALFQGALSITPAVCQTPPTAPAATPQKPTDRDFGSSLDRLKWDQKKQAAVENYDSKTEPGAENDDDVVRIETRLVVSDVVVMDQKGRYIEGLTQKDFIVNEDGQPQKISQFSHGDDANIGRSIVLILDYSPSLGQYIGLSAGAAQKLIDQLGPKDRMAIVTDDVMLLVDFTSNKAELSKGLNLLVREVKSNRFGSSNQFSALLATIRELFSVEDVRPIIIFQTDGDQLGFMQPVDPLVAQNPRVRDMFVQFSLNDVNSAVEKSRRITIYSVIPGLRLIGLPQSAQAERADKILANDIFTAYQRRLQSNPTLPPPAPVTLTAEDSAHNAAVRLEMQQAAAGVAELTGGKTFFLEQPEQAESIYSQILSDVNHRYIIGYYPANKAVDGKRRRVTVEVRNHPEYTVEGRKSYIPAVSP